MDFPILLDRDAKLPLQRQLYLEIRKAILSGRLAPGRRLPSTRGLARLLDLSRTTTALAYEQLAGEGYLEPARGSGTFVCRSCPDGFLEPEGAVLEGSAAGPGLRLSAYGGRMAAVPDIDPPPGASFYNFTPGCPSLEDVPAALWLQLLARHARRDPGSALGYAPDPLGHGPLREAIADYLKRSRAVKCDPDQVIVVGGTQMAITLALKVLVDPGETVAMEDPGYQKARRALQAHGARILPLPAGDGGLDLAPLDQPGEASARLVYVTPSHQFPTGSVLDLPRRLRLLKWCREHGAMVLEDDYDSEFRFRGRPLPAMQGLDPAPVLYAGTFSKVLFPSLRLGYLVVPPALAKVFAKTQWAMARAPSLLQQRALDDFIREGHLERHIRRMRVLYARCRDALVESLLDHFGDRVAILGDDGGMHLTARFRTGLEDAEVVRRAAAAGVVLPALAGYLLEPRPGGAFIFGFSGMSPQRIREAVRRLAALGL